MALVSVGAEARDELIEWRTRPILGWLRRPSDMDEACNLLLGLDAERVEHAAVVRVPLGEPARGKAERVRGEDQTRGGGAGGEHLLPFWDFDVRGGTADHGDHQRRLRQPLP